MKQVRVKDYRRNAQRVPSVASVVALSLLIANFGSCVASPALTGFVFLFFFFPSLIATALVFPFGAISELHWFQMSHPFACIGTQVGEGTNGLVTT